MVEKSQARGAVFNCEFCGKEFFVPRYEINYRATIKYCSQECYHTASRKPVVKKRCAYCEREFPVSAKHKEKKFCSIECSCAYRRERDRKPTRGASGYKYVWFSDGSSQKEHRYIMEQVLGRKLEPDEVVHHIDGNRDNNSLDNLVVMKRGEHSALHRRMEIENGKTLFGGGSCGHQ